MNSKVWKDIVGYEGLYQISNYGDVLSLRTGNLMKVQLKKTGYYQIGLTGYDKKQRSKRVHRLVALHFCVKKPTDTVVNHLDFNKTNNYHKNLEWTTVKGNTKHAYDNLDIMKEIQMKASKLGVQKTRKQIIAYKNGIKVGVFKSKKDCALKLGISEKTIYNRLVGNYSSRTGFDF